MKLCGNAYNKFTFNYSATITTTNGLPPFFENGIVSSLLRIESILCLISILFLSFAIARYCYLINWLTQLPSKSNPTVYALVPHMHMLCVRLESRVYISTKSERKTTAAPCTFNIFTLLWIRFRCLISVTYILYLFSVVFFFSSLLHISFNIFFLLVSATTGKKNHKKCLCVFHHIDAAASAVVDAFFSRVFTVHALVFWCTYSLNGIRLQLY